jgi:hypothetical protein
VLHPKTADAALGRGHSEGSPTCEPSESDGFGRSESEAVPGILGTYEQCPAIALHVIGGSPVAPKLQDKLSRWAPVISMTFASVALISA